MAFELQPNGNAEPAEELRRFFEGSLEDAAAEKLRGLFDERNGETVYGFFPAGLAVGGAGGGSGSGVTFEIGGIVLRYA